MKLSSFIKVFWRELGLEDRVELEDLLGTNYK